MFACAWMGSNVKYWAAMKMSNSLQQVCRRCRCCWLNSRDFKQICNQKVCCLSTQVLHEFTWLDLSTWAGDSVHYASIPIEKLHCNVLVKWLFSCHGNPSPPGQMGMFFSILIVHSNPGDFLLLDKFTSTGFINKIYNMEASIFLKVSSKNKLTNCPIQGWIKSRKNSKLSGMDFGEF